MAKYHGKLITSAFIEAVGLNPNQWQEVTIKMGMDDIVRVEAKGFAELDKDGEQLTPLFQEFELRLKDGTRVNHRTKFPLEEGASE